MRQTGQDGQGAQLIALATAVSMQLAQQYDAQQLAVLFSFFSVIGDELGLLSAARPQPETPQACRDDAISP